MNTYIGGYWPPLRPGNVFQSLTWTSNGVSYFPDDEWNPSNTDVYYGLQLPFAPIEVLTPTQSGVLCDGTCI